MHPYTIHRLDDLALVQLTGVDKRRGAGAVSGTPPCIAASWSTRLQPLPLPGFVAAPSRESLARPGSALPSQSAAQYDTRPWRRMYCCLMVQVYSRAYVCQSKRTRRAIAGDGGVPFDPANLLSGSPQRSASVRAETCSGSRIETGSASRRALS